MRYFLVHAGEQPWVLAESPDESWLKDMALTWHPAVVLAGDLAELDSDYADAIARWRAGDDGVYLAWLAAEASRAEDAEDTGDETSAGSWRLQALTDLMAAFRTAREFRAAATALIALAETVLPHDEAQRVLRWIALSARDVEHIP